MAIARVRVYHDSATKAWLSFDSLFSISSSWYTRDRFNPRALVILQRNYLNFDDLVNSFANLRNIVHNYATHTHNVHNTMPDAN